MKLLQLQQEFTRLLAKLIEFAYSKGFALTVGEAYRPPETASLYAKAGKGIAGSLHCERLAIDLNLFIDDKYIEDSAAYKPLGEYWESLSKKEVECCWGGRFKGKNGKPKPDGNHFSVAYAGKK